MRLLLSILLFFITISADAMSKDGIEVLQTESTLLTSADQNTLSLSLVIQDLAQRCLRDLKSLQEKFRQLGSVIEARHDSSVIEIPDMQLDNLFRINILKLMSNPDKDNRCICFYHFDQNIPQSKRIQVISVLIETLQAIYSIEITGITRDETGELREQLCRIREAEHGDGYDLGNGFNSSLKRRVVKLQKKDGEVENIYLNTILINGDEHNIKQRRLKIHLFTETLPKIVSILSSPEE